MFVAISFDSMFTALSLKSFGTPLWKIPLLTNRFLLLALLGSAVMLAVALLVPPVMVVVSTVPLAWSDIGILAGVGLVDLALVETVKYFLFIRPEAQARAARSAA
jgi:magnesium-transporting ATPase (P-type)